MNEGREDIFVVINIGSSWLSGILARKHSDGRVRPIHACRVPAAGAIRQGCIHNMDAAARYITQIVDELTSHLSDDASIQGVYVGLDCRSMHSETFTASLQLGSEPREIKQADLEALREQVDQAHYEGQRILAITDPRYLVDGRREYTPRGVMGRRIEAQYKVIVVRQNILAHIEELIARLELQLLGTLPAPLVEARATLTTEESALGCAYINMGGGTTSIAIYKERLLQGLFIIPLGGQCVTRDLTSLPTPLLEKDAELLKISEGSMDTSIPRGEIIERMSPESGKAIRIDRLELNRFVDARVRELLWNCVHLIHESGNEANVSRGLVFAGGVTRTRFFYETLEQLNFEYRRGTLRREVYDERLELQPEGATGGINYLGDYMSELALAWWAQKSGVSYQLRDLDTFMQDEPEPTPAATTQYAAPVEEPQRAADDFTFEPLDQKLRGYLEEAEEHEETEERTGKKGGSTSQWLSNVWGKLTKALAPEEHPEDDDEDEDDGEIHR